MSEGDLGAIILTLKLASLTTLILLVFATPLAWWLARSRGSLRNLLEPIVALPLVLPPTVMGFYLLLLFSPNNPLGQFWLWLTGYQLAFSFSALVLGSVVYSLPFFVQPLQIAFENIEKRLLDAAATLGASPWDSFFSLVVPLARRGFIVATCLAFAHTIGEFGIVLMIGGSIPDETRVLSILLFDHVESLQYQKAHILAAGLLVFSFVLLSIVYRVNRTWQSR